jgi:hypothetical protein
MIAWQTSTHAAFSTSFSISLSTGNYSTASLPRLVNLVKCAIWAVALATSPGICGISALPFSDWIFLLEWWTRLGN